MDVLTVHYNTPEMMDAMIRSVNKHTECNIYVFDNSDKRPFENKFDNVTVFDNTGKQIIDFDFWLRRYPDKVPRSSNFGSPKHCKSVNIAMKYLPDGFILMDSDVLVKKDFSSLWDNRYAWVGQPNLDNPVKHPVWRVLPFLCYINVPMCRRYGVRYFNSEWMWHLTAKDPNKWYDTGAWFYKDCLEKGLPHKKINVSDYIEHFNHGSHSTLNGGLEEWLKVNKALWK